METEKFEMAFKDELNLFVNGITKKEEFENYAIQILQQAYEAGKDAGWMEGWEDHELPF